MERSQLTPRELEVVRLLSQGCTYGRIADRLGISEGTVTSHIKNVYRKLDVHCASAAVFRVLALKLIPLGSEDAMNPAVSG